MGYYFTIICKLALFFVSNLGWWEYFRRKSGMNVFFLPAFTISLQVTVLFCAGILNCLEVTVWAMYGAGILLALYYLRRDYKNVSHIYWNGGYIFLTVSFCVILAACKGRVFICYDNFSHWALVVKSMLLTDRFPCFQDTIIRFQEYPLGSSSYIYYFAKLVSNSESAQMAAQGFMMISFLLPVFKCVKRNMAVSWIYVFVFMNYIFCYCMPITDLLVDTLLPLQGMALLFFVYSECLDSLNKIQGGRVCALYAIPFLCTAAQIKNSGIFFVIIACILFGISIMSKKSWSACGKVVVRQLIIVMASPFVSIYLWHAHCGYVFSDGAMTKHAMTFQNYKEVFSQKAEGDISLILYDTFKFSIMGKELYFILLFIGIIGVVAYLLGGLKTYMKLVLVSVGIYVAYMMGMAAMYLFSMPGAEATNLASSERYRKTIFIAIYYMFFVFSLVLISSVEDIRKGWIHMVAIYTALCIVWATEGEKPFPVIFTETEDEGRTWLLEVMENNNIPWGASCLVCSPNDEYARYIYHLCRYFLWSDPALYMVVTDSSLLDRYAGEFEYLLLYDDENPIIQEWVRENYPEQKGNSAVIKIN